MPSRKKNILLFNPSFDAINMYLPYFWASAKTYYERNGLKSNDYSWVNPHFNYYNNIEEIQKFIRDNPPDIFGISLYVWNHTIALKTADWVRKEFPDCLIISGGPHQYFKHETSWFADNPFLDASLAGDDYGELTMCDILDQFDSKDTINWNQVHAVVYPNKTRSLILQSKKTQNKRHFNWEFSAYYEQYQHLLEYKNSMKKYNPWYRSAAAFETTRGCPYACTFCDWGGGTASKVVAKDMTYVRQDLNSLADLAVEEVFCCDANFGILKERDVEIIQYAGDIKTKHNGGGFTSIYSSGYAKTDIAFPYIKQILEIEAKYNLKDPHTYKLSLQTLDPETLKNIERTDVSFEKHLELARYLQEIYNYDSYAEIVSGLPGITTDKFYHELNVFSKHNIGMSFYEWYLLPETPSYTKEYRERFKLKTVKKMYGIHPLDDYNTGDFERETEIVVSTYSYTLDDYKEMNIGYAWYKAFYNGGFLADTFKQIHETYGLELGDFIKKFYHEFYISNNCMAIVRSETDAMFNNFFTDDRSTLTLDSELMPAVDIEKYMVIVLFLHLDKFKEELVNWIHTTWTEINPQNIFNDIAQTITINKSDRIKDLENAEAEGLFIGGKQLKEFLLYFNRYGPPPQTNFLRIKT